MHPLALYRSFASLRMTLGIPLWMTKRGAQNDKGEDNYGLKEKIRVISVISG
jgi:hypothetical protein